MADTASVSASWLTLLASDSEPTALASNREPTALAAGLEVVTVHRQQRSNEIQLVRQPDSILRLTDVR